MELFLIVIFSMAFVFALVILLYVLMSGNKIGLQRRLAKITDRTSTSKQKKKEKNLSENLSGIVNSISGGNIVQRLSDELSVASIPLKAEEFILLWIMAIVLPSTIVGLFTLNIMVSIVIGIIGAIIPILLLKRAKAKRLIIFDAQLSDALSIMSNSLRSGFSLLQSMQSIANEMPEPISKEFARTLREIKLGMSIENALKNMMQRISNQDLELIVSAILIQRQVGGNLSEILDSISKTIKERIQIKKDVRVLTSSARTSGTIVGLLPVFLLGILILVNPEYMELFFTTKPGIFMLVVAAVLEAIGFSVVKKIVSIKF